MRKIVKMRNLLMVLLCLNIWSGCSGLAERGSTEEALATRQELTMAQETQQQEPVFESETVQPTETASPDEVLQRWNVSGELLRDLLLRHFSNLNCRYEQEARNGDYPKERDPLQYLMPYGAYFIEIYEATADLPLDEEHLAQYPYSVYVHEGELLVRYGAVEWLENGDIGRGLYTTVRFNELGYPYLSSADVPGTVDELREYLRPVYEDTFYVERNQRYAYEDFPEKEEIVAKVWGEMETRLNGRLEADGTADVYILDFEIYETYACIQAVSYIDSVMYVDVFSAQKKEDEIVIQEVQRGSGQIRLEAEEQRQQGYTREMAQERAIEVFTYPEPYTLSELLRLEEWVTQESEILLMIENTQSDSEGLGEVYRVRAEHIPDFLKWAKETEVLPHDGKEIYSMRPLNTIIMRDAEAEIYKPRENSHDIMLYDNGLLEIDYMERYVLADGSAFCVDDFLEIAEPVEIFSAEELLMAEALSEGGAENYTIEYMDIASRKQVPCILVETGTEELRGVECRYEVMWWYAGYSCWRFGTVYGFCRMKTYYRADTGEYFDRYDTSIYRDFTTGERCYY